MATEWDGNRVYHANMQVPDGSAPENESQHAKQKFSNFINEFHHHNVFVYKKQLTDNCLIGQYKLEVMLEELMANNADLATKFRTDPAKYSPWFEEAIRKVAEDLKVVGWENLPEFQLIIRTSSRPLQIRQLDSTHIGKLVAVPGIVISTSKTRPKVTQAIAQCTFCKTTKEVSSRPGLLGIPLPRRCDRQPLPGESKCPLDSFVILPERCKFVDQQTMKLQESPELVPTGEMPRHILLYADRHLVESTTPGSRVVVVGIYSITEGPGKSSSTGAGSGAVAVRHPYLRALGITAALDANGNGDATMLYDLNEVDTYIKLSKDPKIYQHIARSIDSAIFGCEDIKKAIACLLFGGTRKGLPDGIRIRGDINVLLLGDPSTAKSQLLKFAKKIAPIGVYTSGKGSSAAGLTASVIRDPHSGEFYLEGGSMVLADGGVICIDEFDKMNERDRVAIHEAMEQQTISIAKAGITTVLNSRTSVLAAANPVQGRYDDDRAADEQIDFQTTILSRFDMIFIIKDIQDEQQDRKVASHVLNLHMHKEQDAAVPDIEQGLLRRYIAYCRSTCAPRLSKEAAATLENFYVSVRANSKSKSARNGPTIPITVRQLEAIVRIAESLAKMSLSEEANNTHVEGAIYLFKRSTIDAIERGGLATEVLTDEQKRVVQQIEDRIRRRMAIGSKESVEALHRWLRSINFSRQDVQTALRIMVQRKDLQFTNQRVAVVRKK